MIDELIKLLILIPAFTLPFITFLIPFSMAWRLWLFYISFLHPIAWLEKGAEDFEFGLIIIYTILFLGVALLAIRYFFHRFWHPKALENYIVPKRELRIIDIILSIFIGCCASIIMIIKIAFIFQNAQNGYIIHTLAGTIALSAAIIALKYELKNTPLNFFVIALSSSLCIASFAGLYYPNIVIANAKKIANKNPYCIAFESTDPNLYNLEQLAFYTMPKNKGIHHAYLLVKKDDKIIPYHWSYRSMTFMFGIVNWNNENRPFIGCIPTPNFIENLPARERNN